jgi:hypothetical protein
MELIKVMSWGKDQGEYVLIEASDFDESIHKKYVEPKVKPEPKAKAETE